MNTYLARPRRSGFTLVELMVSLVVLSVVMGAMMMTLARQQRFYSGLKGVIQTRDQVRQALGLLPSELRALSPSQNDIYAMTDSSIEFRAITGSSVLCAKSILTANAIIMPPTTLARGNTLTTWLTKPIKGDSLLILDDGASAVLSDDVWQLRGLTLVDSATGLTGCTSFTKLVTSSDASKYSPKWTLGAAIPNTVKTGAPIRFFRRVRYNFYKTPNGQWFLGWADCNPNYTTASKCSDVLPVSGPYRPYASPASGTSGLTFSYFDSTGAKTTTPAAVAQINIVVRGESKIPIWSSELFRDSLALSIGVRNRN